MVLEIQQRIHELDGSAIDTIYFGGGTPSLLTYEQLMLLLDTIHSLGNVSPQPEITLEANPDDLKKELIKRLEKTPVNRLSIGIQSFNDDDLTRMNRAHKAAQADYAVKLAQDSGFENITIDLIYGIPGSSQEQWERNLHQALALNIQHLSAYCLTIEERTAYGKWEKEGIIKQVDDASIHQQYRTLIDRTQQAGFEHYEVSNFALPNYRSKHNSSYWKGLPYLGIGPSAHSFDGNNKRRWNIANNPVYIRKCNQSTVYWEEELLSKKDVYNEYIMTGLRTKEGVNIKKTEQTFGISLTAQFAPEIESAVNHEWMVIANDVISLTEEGMFRADRIASDLFITTALEE